MISNPQSTDDLMVSSSRSDGQEISFLGLVYVVKKSIETCHLTNSSMMTSWFLKGPTQFSVLRTICQS